MKVGDLVISIYPSYDLYGMGIVLEVHKSELFQDDEWVIVYWPIIKKSHGLSSKNLKKILDNL